MDMPQPLNQTTTVLLALASLLIATVFAIKSLQPTELDCGNLEALQAQRFQLDRGFQTSSAYLYKLAKWNACHSPENAQQQLQYQLVSDIHIKARSYALINKIAFWVSLVFILMIFGIPIAYAAKEAADKDDTHPKRLTFTSVLWKLLSPVQIPAITLVAGLAFTLYQDYKQKQSQAESLMRYVLFSEQPTAQLNKTVIDTLAVIDTGFSFTSFLSGTKTEATDEKPKE
jgi:hypothetical protein